jgi:hypothetical protein
MEKEKIVRELCAQFHLVAKTVTYTDRVELLYIYRHVLHTSGHKDLAGVIPEIVRLRRATNSRQNRGKLHEVFSICQLREVMDCGRYDTTTFRPPPPRPEHSGYEY